MSVASTLKQAFLSAFVDGFRLIFINRRILRRFENWESEKDFEPIRELSKENLENLLTSEWVRAKELDDKLSKLTAALSVALTVGGAVAKTIFDGLAPSPLKTIILILLFLSMGFFLWGALIGFRGLRPKPRYAYGAAYLNAVASGEERATKERQKAACGFQATNMVRANEASVAIDLIRNGVVVFAVAVALSFFPAPVPTKGSEITKSEDLIRQEPSTNKLDHTKINSANPDADPEAVGTGDGVTKHQNDQKPTDKSQKAEPATK